MNNDNDSNPDAISESTKKSGMHPVMPDLPPDSNGESQSVDTSQSSDDNHMEDSDEHD